ncbi:MAG: LysR family transcriptional regulator, partial [Venatoribacter sp.]
MNIKQLNFRHLFSFWRVAQEQHLTRAAEKMHVSQSTLSTQISQLEQALDEALFERVDKRLQLTAIGEQVFQYAESIFGMGEEMLGWLQGQEQGRTRVRLGAVTTMSRNYQANWIRPLISNTQVDFSVETGLLDDLVERLHRHQLDIILANAPIANDPKRPLLCQFLGSQAISIVGPAMKWQGRHLNIPDDLDGLELALPSTRHTLRAEFDALCMSANIQPIIRAELDDMSMLRLVARDSGWLTLLPQVVVQDELEQGVLTIVGQSDKLKEQFYAITNQRHR